MSCLLKLDILSFYLTSIVKPVVSWFWTSNGGVVKKQKKNKNNTGSKGEFYSNANILGMNLNEPFSTIRTFCAIEMFSGC